MAFTKINAAGIGSTELVTLHSLEVLNNATVGGVLTYEDVTNVDSIGLITARNGIVVGSGITLSKDGDIFATGVTTSTTFVGALTGTASNASGATGDFSIADKIVHTGDTNTAIRFPAADTITAETGGSERLRIDSSGQLLVGSAAIQYAASPFYASGTNPVVGSFHHSDGGTDDQARIALGALENNPPYNRGVYLTAENNGAGHDFLVACSASHSAGPTEKLRITSDGKIGIGLASPKTDLDIANDAGGTLTLSCSDDSSSANQLIGKINFHTADPSGDGPQNNAIISAHSVESTGSGAYLKFSTATGATGSEGADAVERLRIDSSGRVGISRTPTGHMLEVQHASEPTISLWTDTTKRIALQYNSSATYLYSYQDSPILFSVASGNSFSERVRIDSDGLVISGSGGLFGKIVRSAAAYTANTNIDISLTVGNYIFSVRSAGVYHFNGIYVVTYYDSADKSSAELVHGDYSTTVTHSVIHNGNNNGTFRLVFNRDFTTLNISQLKLS